MSEARQQEYILKSRCPQLLHELMRTIAYETPTSFNRLLELAFVHGNLPAVRALMSEAEQRPDRFDAQRNLRLKLRRYIRYNLGAFAASEGPELLKLVSPSAQAALFRDLLQSSPALNGERLFALLDGGISIGQDCVLSAARRLYSCQGSVAMEAMRALVQRGYSVNVKPQANALNLDFLGPEDDPVMGHPCGDGTPLHCSALYAIGVDFLLLHGADCLATDANGNTPLVYAATEGHCEAIRSLLAHCPRAVNLANASGQTALSILAEKCHSDCVLLLLGNGADPRPVIPSLVSTAVSILRAHPGGPRSDPFGTLDALLGHNCLHHPGAFSLAGYFPPSRVNLTDLVALAASGARAADLLLAPPPRAAALSDGALARLRTLYLAYLVMFKLPAGPAWLREVTRQTPPDAPPVVAAAAATLREWLAMPPSLLLLAALRVHALLGPAGFAGKVDRLGLPGALRRRLFLVGVRPV